MKKIAIFASGSGSNAEEILKKFENDKNIKVSLILSNNPDAFVLERAKKFNVPSITISKKYFNSDQIVKILQEEGIDLVVLAGFLWLIPLHLIKAFPNKIINIHPALLPKYGGKGMYGMNVHNAVKENNETESGITIHYVNENYDEGKHILQAKVEINKKDTSKDIAGKIHQLEHEHFPKVIERLLKDVEN